MADELSLDLLEEADVAEEELPEVNPLPPMPPPPIPLDLFLLNALLTRMGVSYFTKENVLDDDDD